MLKALPPHWRFFFLLFAGYVNREQQKAIDYLMAEREGLLELLGDKRRLLSKKHKRRLAVKAKALGRSGLKKIGTIVTPDTLMRWYRELIAVKYDGSKSRKSRPVGRPRTSDDICALIVKMAKENNGWGYGRIKGALKTIGIKVSRSTIKRVLQAAGIEPAPHRGMPWSTFLSTHWGAICGCDFFTIEIMTLSGITRFYVFFVIELESRTVEIAGICGQPDEAWMKQIVRNLTDCTSGFLRGITHIIMDRDPVYTKVVRTMLKDRGTKPVRLPAESPNLNAFAERFVLTIKSECLEKMVILGERHLRESIKQFMIHYHAERTHQGIDNELIQRDVANDNVAGEIVCRERLRGLLKFYHRQAA